MEPKKAAKKAARPRKRAAKKVAEPEIPTPPRTFDASEDVIPALNLQKDWPERIVEKHAQRHAALIAEAQRKQEAKKQRMIEGGIPPEKHSL